MRPLTGLPRHLLAAGVLVWDADGRILVVQTHNRDYAILPGGLVEEHESPASAARRECREELGVDVRVGRLLAVQHLVVPSVDDSYGTWTIGAFRS